MQRDLCQVFAAVDAADAAATTTTAAAAAVLRSHLEQFSNLCVAVTAATLALCLLDGSSAATEARPAWRN